MDDDARSPGTGALPTETLRWLAGTGGHAVLTIGGHGLAEALAEHGNDVRPVSADEHPLPETDHAVDMVVAADSLPSDLLEVARVLRPGGHLALVVSDRDHRIPWARKLDAAIGATRVEDPAAALVTSPLFGFVDETTHRSWQVVNRGALGALLPTLPALSGLEPADRDERIAAALALYDDYGRGVDGMQLPWVIRCYRATVVENAYLPPRPLRDAAAAATGPAAAEVAAPGTATEETATGETGPRPAPGTPGPAAGPATGAEEFTFSADGFDDTGMLLIDFR